MLRVAARWFFIPWVLIVSACAGDIPSPETPKFSFTGDPPFTLKGTAVSVENMTVSKAGNVEAIYPIGPSEIARAWAADRLRVSGGQGRVVMRIVDASVTEESLPTQHGFVGYLAGEQNKQYAARLKVDVLIYGGPRETQPGRVSAEVTASRAVAANAGPRGSEADYYTLLETLAREFNGALSAQMSAYTVGY